MPRTNRRRMLSAVGATLSTLAGCTQFQIESEEEAGQGDASDLTTAAGASETAAATATTERATIGQTGTASEELDLREANVVGTEITDENGGDYRFDVTLYHDDDGEDGYANWWQVETLAGDRLGRRDLRHAHSTAPFTRSETIPVPDDVSCVVVRGHDRTHGYGGQAMTVAVPGGETRTVAQGSEQQPVARSDCP